MPTLDGAAPSSLLTLKGITKHYQPTEAPALNGIDLELATGEILGLLGPSGCGKTTLLRVVAGFERHQQGTVQLGGQLVSGAGTWIPPEKRGIGLVFQDFALFPHLTVMENVQFGLKKTSGSRRRFFGLQSTTPSGQLTEPQIQQRATEVLELVGLKDFGHRYPHELSGGQQQRVALARALAPRPALILLDEPLSNLDVQVRFYLRNQIRSILKATQTSALFVTHDQEEALVVSDRVAVMRKGVIEQLGTPEEIYSSPATRFVAEFVTQANFVPAQRQGEGWLTEMGSLLSHDVVAQGSPHLPAGELMIRQEDLRVDLDPEGSAWVKDCQFLGREYRYCLESSTGQTFHALSDHKVPLGSRVRVGLADQSYRVFSSPESPAPIRTMPGSRPWPRPQPSLNQSA